MRKRASERTHSGTKVKAHSVKGAVSLARQIMKHGVIPNDLAALIQSNYPSHVLSQNEGGKLEHRWRSAAETESPFKIVVPILTAIALLPFVLSLIFGLDFMFGGICWAAVWMAFMIFLIKFTKLNIRFSGEKCHALTTGKYSAYRLDIAEKLWFEYYSSDPDGGGKWIEQFFINCGGVTFEVTNELYNTLNDSAIIILLFIREKTAMEIIVPDGSGQSVNFK